MNGVGEVVIRAPVLLAVLIDSIQPFSSFSRLYEAAVMALYLEIMDTIRLPDPSSGFLV